ncbi:hypothetical protein KC799_09875 [candidate division KSB1 bacterium]|nr:hypothetical protein [candidate division KSB1 bacterium]
MKRVQVPVTQLLLDSENPRHDTLNSQTEIIQELLTNEQVFNLAKDIVNQKSLSPLDVIGVIPSTRPDEYIVVEGNRRVCACLLLNNPELCENSHKKLQFKKLAESTSDIPGEVECVVFSDRNSADHWIRLRHEGQQDGIGVKRWTADQIARYADKKGRKNPNIQATKLLDYAVFEGIISPGKKASLSVTTLQRYLNNPFVRNIFGLQDRETLLSKHSPEAFRKVVERFVDDAITNIVNSRSGKDDWKEYANELQREVTEAPPKNNPIVDYSAEVGSKDGNQKSTPKSRMDPSKRKYLLPYSTKIQVADRTLNRLYLEMRALPVEGHEFSINYLMRTFLEATINQYLKKNLPAYDLQNKRLHQRIGEVSKDLEAKGVDRKIIQPLNVASSEKNSKLSPLVFGSVVHLTLIPTKRELIAIWDQFENALVFLHEEINKN